MSSKRGGGRLFTRDYRIRDAGALKNETSSGLKILKKKKQGKEGTKRSGSGRGRNLLQRLSEGGSPSVQWHQTFSAW